MTRHLETLSAALSSSQSLTSSMHEPVSRGWRDGRDTGGSGKKNVTVRIVEEIITYYYARKLS